MKKVILMLTVLLIMGCTTEKLSNNLTVNKIERLKKLTIEEFHEIDQSYSSESLFYIIANFNQYIDHNNHSLGTFKQRISILHRSIDKPVVLVTGGYSIDETTDELGMLLNANVISVNHRYYKGALPENPDYRYLTLEQASADYHEIVNEFKKIYKDSKWISTGQSKGGLTALSYKRFYPSDVDAVVARSAPLQLGHNDARLKLYTEDKKRAAMINKMNDFLEIVKNRKEELLPLIDSRINSGGIAKSTLSTEELFNWFIWYYPSTLWQHGYDHLDKLPDANTSPYELIYHLTSKSIDRFNSSIGNDGKHDADTIAFHYQSAKEIGAVYFDNLNFPELIEVDDSELDKSVMVDLASWLKENGNNIIYIYGEEDMFTSFQVDIGTKTNAIKIIQPNAFHNIRLASLDEFDICASTLLEWLE